MQRKLRIDSYSFKHFPKFAILRFIIPKRISVNPTCMPDERHAFLYNLHVATGNRINNPNSL